MNYEIHIQDVDQLADPLIEHYAERNSPRVEYLGGDDPTQPIVPSLCGFSLETNDGQDGKYDQYFTSNEKKYLVTKVISDTQEIVWRGYLLPETYQEPYLNPLFYTYFEAVDGLGLLKGRELPEDFYSKEKSVIEILSECLQLTQIDFDIYLSPAIQNKLKRNWKDIILDTKKYFDEEKLPSAYDFLEDIIFSMRCQLFQCEGRWYIEGINKRHLPKNTFFKYSITGEFLGTVDINKNVKSLKHFLSADVSMMPALGKVTVIQEAPELKLADNIYKDDGDGDWIVPIGVDGSFYPREWNYTELFRPKHYPPDNFLELPATDSELGVFDPRERKISLKNRPYIRKGTRVSIKLAAQFIDKLGITGGSGGLTAMENAYQNGEFIDPFKYRIFHAGALILSNNNTQEFDPTRLSLDVSGKGEIQLYFITTADGYLNIELHQPTGLSFADPYIQIKNLTIEKVGQAGKEVIELIVDEKSSVTKEVELKISDNILANSKSWQLEKLREYDSTETQLIEVPILYYQFIDGKHYSIVSLEGAVLIEQFPDNVFWRVETRPVVNPKVHYNLNGSGEMAIEVNSPYSYGNFYVNVQPYKRPETDRLDWLKWVDSVYGLESKTYAEIVADIEKNLAQIPRLNISGSVDYPLKYNDLIEFEWKGKKRLFSLIDLQWNPDDNESTFILNEAIYGGSGTAEQPPIVYAGSDHVISGEDSEVTVYDAEVIPTNGNIASLLWEQVVGTGATFNNNSILLPVISNITGDNNVFRLTAVDSKGSSASDEMQVIKSVGYVISTTTPVVTSKTDRTIKTKETICKIVVTPELSQGESILINFSTQINVIGDIENNGGLGYINVMKNGVRAFTLQNDKLSYEKNDYAGDGGVNYTAGDNIELQLHSSLFITSALEVNHRVDLTEAAFNNSQNKAISGLPLFVEQNHKL